MVRLMTIKQYLGDGAYVEWDGNQFRLFTTNGVIETNEIFMEPFALDALNAFAARLEEERGNPNDEA
jgi:hypothetical protein